MEAVSLFFTYALTALFLENVIFTRTLGVGRMTIFGSPKKIMIQGALLSVVLLTSSLLCHGFSLALYDYSGRVALPARALLFLGCVTAVYALLALAMRFVPPLAMALKLLPLSAFNCAVLGSLVLSVTSRQSLAATAGYALGAGVGYTLALLLVYSGRSRLELTPTPRAFRGVPITLLYIGIVSLAVFGLIGHQLPT